MDWKKKMKDWIIRLGLVSVAALSPVHNVMIAAGVLILFDLIMGIWRAKKQGEPITSQGLRRSLSKLCSYEIAIVTGFLIEKNMMDFIPVAKIIGGMIALTEGLSVLENVRIVTGIDFKTAILSKLQGIKDVEKKL